MQRNTFFHWTPAAIACLTLTAALPAAGPRTSPGDGPRDGLARRQALVSQAVNEAGVTGRLVDLDLDHTPGLAVVTDIVIDGETYTVELLPRSMRAPEYRLLVQIEDGSLVEHDPGPVRTFRGEVLGMPGSVAFGSLESDGLHAMIDLHGAGPGERHWVEPISSLVDGGEPGEHLVYHDTGIECHGGTCAVAGHQHEFDGRRTDDDAGRGDATDPPMEEAGDGGVAGDELCIWFSKIAADADWEYFDGPGQNNVTTTENRIEAVLNGVSAQYENEVQIEFQITAVVVRSSSSDPYSSTNSAGALLNEFESHWNIFHTDIERAQAQIFTGRNVQAGNDFSVIGLASLASVCTPQGYSLVEDISPFVCRKDLTAHELGHNWSAQHCSCSNFTMNSGLTCANQFTTGSENSIIAHRNSRTCLDMICPPDNDDCADAITIGSGDTPYSSVFSTTDGPTETLCTFNGDITIGRDIWFKYAAPCEGNITFSICDADYNAKMAIYDGSICPTGTNTALACNDDSCTDGPELTVFAVEGQEFLIRVGGFTAQQGQGTLNITPAEDCFSVPGNDTCSAGTTLNEGTKFFNTAGANSEGFSECDVNGSSSIDKDIWYRHIVQCDGDLTISLCGSDFDTKLAVYSSSCPSGPNQAIECSDDDCGDDAEITIPVTAGQLYRFRVGGAAGSSGFGQVTLTCDDTPPPCDGDTDGDGFVNVNDLNNVILDWGTDGSANGGDLTGPVPGSPPDGAVDVNDLNAVIVNWGACP